MFEEGGLKRAAREARASGAELVIASVHWGAEYWRVPHPAQVDSARRIVAAGVDLLIGHHPHVLQPIERRRTADGRDTLIAYSLGNLLSNQGHDFVPGARERDGDTRDVAILRVTLTRADDGALRIADASAVALWTEHTATGGISLVPAMSRRARVAGALGAPLSAPPSSRGGGT
jgi:poly-gamma-glutamate capsule biosynthesis protein CapA/YwtB (metallophosphatase superfamily)